MIPAPARVPFGDDGVAVPEEPFELDVPAPEDVESGVLDDRALASALDDPAYGPPIAAGIDEDDSVLVLVSDATRETGARRFLGPLVDRIRDATRGAVRFGIGTGLHRAPTTAEIERILGPRMAANHDVVLHDPDDEDSLVDVGRTRAGTAVRVNRALLDHDRLVLTGACGFHYYAGFSGGRKAIVPGMAGRNTIAQNHLRATRRDGTPHPDARAGRLAGNPVHRDMVEGAALLRPSFLVNSVIDARGRIEALFTGHWRRAHEAACRYVRRTRTLYLEPRPLAVVSAGGYPHDLNLIQAHKAFEAAFPALREGGVAILVAECRDRGGHPDFLPAFDHPTEADHVRALRDDFRVYGQTALAWRRKASRCRLILVSDLDDATVRSLGAEPARDLDDAFGLAKDTVETGSRGWLLPHGVRFRVESLGEGRT